MKVVCGAKVPMERKFHGTKVLGTFAPEERKFHGSESSMERKFLDFSLPGSECSMERKFHGSESALYGLFAPGNESAEERKGQLPNYRLTICSERYSNTRRVRCRTVSSKKVFCHWGYRLLSGGFCPLVLWAYNWRLMSGGILP